MILKIALIAIITCCLGLSATNLHAQSLGELLNDKPNYGSNGQPLTAAVMANDYYKSCINEDSLVFNQGEKKVLCGCNSAKMSELLTVQDFKDLYKRTNKGKDARSRMLAFSYAPCMEYVIEKKVTDDCYDSSQMDDILRGGKAICNCVVERFNQYITKNAAHIILTASHYDPMTLNPLEHYFTNRSYHAQHKGYLRQCHYTFVYDRDNR